MKLLGLIGFPLSHSFSAAYFAAKFEQLALHEYEYRNFPIPSIEAFPPLIREYVDLIGLNVTIPYKQQVIPYLDELDPTAAALKAVNTIHFKHGKTIGYNTDVIGFEQSFQPLVQPHHTHALILGTGGAAQAVAAVLKKIGIHYLFVTRGNAGTDRINYTDLNYYYYKQFKVIINCTPLGMYPNTEAFPLLDYSLLNAQHLLFDTVYNPAQTQFMLKGAAHGVTTKNGYDMLVFQAEAAWKIWNTP